MSSAELHQGEVPETQIETLLYEDSVRRFKVSDELEMKQKKAYTAGVELFQAYAIFITATWPKQIGLLLTSAASFVGVCFRCGIHQPSL